MNATEKPAVDVHEGQGCAEDFACDHCEEPTCSDCHEFCVAGHDLCAKCAAENECPVCDDIRSERQTREYVQKMRP